MLKPVNLGVQTLLKYLGDSWLDTKTNLPDALEIKTFFQRILTNLASQNFSLVQYPIPSSKSRSHSSNFSLHINTSCTLNQCTVKTDICALFESQTAKILTKKVEKFVLILDLLTIQPKIVLYNLEVDLR